MGYVWTGKDDYICCRECYIKRLDGISVQSLVYNLKLKLPHIKEGSIKMKIANIVQLFIEKGIKYNYGIAPLCNYSRQCSYALTLVVLQETTGELFSNPLF